MELEVKRIVVLATALEKSFLMGNTTVYALRGVDLAVEQGELIAILGPSGSGKSTLLGLLGGLDTPSSGRVEIGGVDITHMSENRLADIRNKKIGFVFQFFNLIPTLTALENVELPIQFSRYSRYQYNKNLQTDADGGVRPATRTMRSNLQFRTSKHRPFRT